MERRTFVEMLAGGMDVLVTAGTPALSHVSVLVNPANPFHGLSEKQIRTAASVLRMKVHFVSVRAEPELDHAFEVITKGRPDGLIMLADRVFLHNRVRIADFAARNRIPGVYAYTELVDAGA